MKEESKILFSFCFPPPYSLLGGKKLPLLIKVLPAGLKNQIDMRQMNRRKKKPKSIYIHAGTFSSPQCPGLKHAHSDYDNNTFT